ncbi:ANTAR domain-containing protein [Mycobacterium sp.]|uniref:ANTAR domain-containing protein n=1 Tax=Mycobacterium sp. TaxID=1785 RepID=UPI003C791449
MTEGIKTELSPGRQESTRAIDTAVGILVGWRGFSTHSAFRELINVSERHWIPIFALAEALVNLASGDARPADAAAQRAAEREWGETVLSVAGTGGRSYHREIDRWL